MWMRLYICRPSIEASIDIISLRQDCVAHAIFYDAAKHLVNTVVERNAWDNHDYTDNHHDSPNPSLVVWGHSSMAMEQVNSPFPERLTKPYQCPNRLNYF